MLNLYTIWTIARYEAKLLFRSWAFRIFSLLGLTVLTVMDIGVGTTIGHAPYYLHALSGSLPLMNLKLLNIYQGIIAAFLATEFIKRDRRHDTSQVVFARPFSNVEYLLGKVAGILTVFAALNLATLLVALFFHAFFSSSVFTWKPYVVYVMTISVPTLVFMMGTSFLLVSLLRSQAVVFVLMLGYSLLVLILLGPYLFNVFDSYAFHQPLVLSDISGLGNTGDLLLLRGAYLLIGIGFMAVTVLLSPRLRQSPVTGIASAIAALIFLGSAAAMGTGYLRGKFAEQDYRRQLQALCAAVRGTPAVTVDTCDISLQHSGDQLSASVRLTAVNKTAAALDSLLFTLNPGLTVSEITDKTGGLSFRRDQHLLWLKPDLPLAPQDTLRFSMTYSGTLHESYCYLDVDRERHDVPYRVWLYSIPKRYAFVQPGYLHLTPEVGWYPLAGLPPGAAFPSAAPYTYTAYTLEVNVPNGQTAITQGAPDSAKHEDGVRRFQPEHRLPGLSLTVGTYDLRRLNVDSVEYLLYTLPGHDGFLPFFDQVIDTLPRIIRETKNEYEIALGLEYPYPRLSLVEVPIQFYSYRRLWTVAQETVQPQIVYLPELGMICAGTDFPRMKRMGTRRQERANQAESPAEIQAGYFVAFVKTDLLGMQADRWSIRGEANIEPRYELLPNYLSYTTHISSDRWPVLNYALESYFQTRVIPPPEGDRWLRWRGLNEREKANQALRHQPLAELLGTAAVDTDIRSAALAAKGQYLLSYLEANVGAAQFGRQITEFLDRRRFHDIADSEFIDFAESLTEYAPAALIDAWYNDTLLPGYLIDNIESYDVIDDEYTRTQLKFNLTNPTAVAGVIKIDIRYRRPETNFGPRGMGGQNQSDYTQLVLGPAESMLELGLVLDQPPAEMTIETFASRNIPSVVNIPFREQKLRRYEIPFEGTRVTPLAETTAKLTNEYLVDNEDAGFAVLSATRENWFRRTLLNLFNSAGRDDRYQDVHFWDPPNNWVLTTNQDFYGAFVHSGYCKQTGDGQSRVAWTAELDDAGDYDIYYYFEGAFEGPRWFRQQRGGTDNDGQKNFLVYHDDGVEELPFDLNGAEQGWNYLGTYRLAGGKNRIELSDKDETDFVTADAVKWVRRQAVRPHGGDEFINRGQTR
jgi:ABC-type transport system involved in multi-copper enzyme maturation permease subunit